MTALAGRNWHSGARPMTNCDSVTGMALPSVFPGVCTSKLTFMRRPHSLGASFVVDALAIGGMATLSLPGRFRLPGNSDRPNDPEGQTHFMHVFGGRATQKCLWK